MYYLNQFVAELFLVMATYETYGERYRDKKTNNSKSVSRIIPSTSFSPSKPNEEPNQLGNVVAKISDRVDGIEIKIVSMTNIIKLLQKYTEKKD